MVASLKYFWFTNLCVLELTDHRIAQSAKELGESEGLLTREPTAIRAHK